jgi:hypothetical protein
MGWNLPLLGLFDGGLGSRIDRNSGNWFKRFRGMLIVVHPPKTNWNGLAYLSLNISSIHKHVVNK